ncbi:MAG: alanine--tRNA ligase [Nanoarchaeota archaeon]
MITRKELIKKYIEFFKSKGHKEIPNKSLLPENDPTVLFVIAGMQPLVPFLLGQKHPLGKRLTNVQKCIRTIDIYEVGDTTHHTFFEMLGNWSLGDYFKEDAIKFSFEFLTRVLQISTERLAVTCFGGDKKLNLDKDNESAKIWESLGIKKERIAFIEGGVLEQSNNWWGPAGQTGPCGPSTEMFYWKSEEIPVPKKFNPEDKKWVEIWNDVLMQFSKDKNGNYVEAKQKNIDTGMGLERTLAVLNGFEDNYLTEVWQPIIKKIEELSGKSYDGNEKTMRIIADHIKASIFMISDGILPSNTEQGYIARRLLRRTIRLGRNLNLKNFTKRVAESIFEIYDDYEHLQKNKCKILEELEKEENKFNQTLENGISMFEKISKEQKTISGKDAFLLFQSYGFPIEITQELAKEKKINVDKKNFEQEYEKHKELSRTASAGMFKSGLADNSEATTKLHTAAHLLLSAIKKILDNNEIHQMGSNITSERLRLDFNFNRKLADEELKKIENLVNQKIKEQIPIIREELSPHEAKKQGATGAFDKKYGEIVSVYTIGDFSKEICTGPHVSNTKELGKFKITKEESSSAGVRRIKAELL